MKLIFAHCLYALLFPLQVTRICYFRLDILAFGMQAFFFNRIAGCLLFPVIVQYILGSKNALDCKVMLFFFKTVLLLQGQKS